MKHVERFLQEGSKVKLTIMFRGREMAHPELGRKILERVAVDVQEYAVVESAPKQDGRNMVMVLNALKKPSAAKKPKPAPSSEAPTGAPSEAQTPATAVPAAPASAFASVGPVSTASKPPRTAPAPADAATPVPEAEPEASTEAAAS
jgi:translation initiation factor IF-3